MYSANSFLSDAYHQGDGPTSKFIFVDTKASLIKSRLVLNRSADTLVENKKTGRHTRPPVFPSPKKISVRNNHEPVRVIVLCEGRSAPVIFYTQTDRVGSAREAG